MPTMPTFEDLKTDAETEVKAANSALTDFTEGSALDALTGSGSVLADEVLGFVVTLFATLFLDTSEGAALDTLIADRFAGMTPRQAASSSVGTETITRGVFVGAWSIPAGSQFQATVDGEDILFTTDALVTMGAADNTVDSSMTASVAGRSGNVAENTVTQILSVLTDTTATATNLTRMAGGAPEETDEELRARARLFYQTLRRGTVAAIEAGALSVAGVSFAKVDEDNPSTPGMLSVYIGDPDGSANAALVTLVETALEDYRPAGISITVTAAAREEIPIELEILVKRGANTATLSASIRSAVKDYVNNLSPSEILYDSQVSRVVTSVDTDVLDVVQVLPSGDFTPSQVYNAVRVIDSGLTLTLTEVA